MLSSIFSLSFVAIYSVILVDIKFDILSLNTTNDANIKRINATGIHALYLFIFIKFGLKIEIMESFFY